MKDHAGENHKHDKIHEALTLLNEAAKEKKDVLSEMIGDKYANVRDILQEKTEDGVEAATRLGKQLTKGLHAQKGKLKKGAHDLDQKIRKNPWTYIGGAALAAFVMGKFFKRK